MSEVRNSNLIPLMAAIRDQREFASFKSTRVPLEGEQRGFRYSYAGVEIHEGDDSLMPYTSGDRKHQFPNLTAAEIDAYARLWAAGDMLVDDEKPVSDYLFAKDDAGHVGLNFNALCYLRKDALGRRIEESIGDISDFLLENTKDDEGFEAYPELDSARSTLMEMVVTHGLFDAFENKCPCCESSDINDAASDGDANAFWCGNCGSSWTTKPMIDSLDVGSHPFYPRKKREGSCE